MIKLCKDQHLIWPMGVGGGPNYYPINPTASQKFMCLFLSYTSVEARCRSHFGSSATRISAQTSELLGYSSLHESMFGFLKCCCCNESGATPKVEEVPHVTVSSLVRFIARSENAIAMAIAITAGLIAPSFFSLVTL